MASKPVSPRALSQLKSEINSDDALRKQFLKDPGKVFEARGIDLPADRRQKLADFVKEVTATNRDARIAGIRPGAANRWEVEITVTVRF